YMPTFVFSSSDSSGRIHLLLRNPSGSILNSEKSATTFPEYFRCAIAQNLFGAPIPIGYIAILVQQENCIVAQFFYRFPVDIFGCAVWVASFCDLLIIHKLSEFW